MTRSKYVERADNDGYVELVMTTIGPVIGIYASLAGGARAGGASTRTSWRLPRAPNQGAAKVPGRSTYGTCSCSRTARRVARARLRDMRRNAWDNSASMCQALLTQDIAALTLPCDLRDLRPAQRSRACSQRLPRVAARPAAAQLLALDTPTRLA